MSDGGEGVAALGRIDILVNNAAVRRPGCSAKPRVVTERGFLGDMNVKVMGYLRCAREVAPT